jgi:uncharacterized protein YbjT (DUF2867 family)
MEGEPAAVKARIVVVAGATGRQGGAVARRLIGEGWRVRGLTRNPKSRKAALLKEAGIEVVKADMADRPALDAAFAGAHGVYSVQNPMISGHEMEIVQGKNVVDAALEAGVAHIVYGSAGPSRDRTGIASWDAKLDVEEHARRRDAPLTVLRPMAFMELMTDKAFYPNVSAWYLMPKLVGSDRPLPWIGVDDLAVVAAAAFARPDALVGQDLPLAADTKSLAECRVLWQEVVGRAPRRFPMPIRLFERFVGQDTTRMWRWLHTNPVNIDATAARRIHPTMATVREFFARHSA